MYSLRYGSVPVVSYTGGLADTVVDTHPDSLHNWTANGFVFHDYHMEAMVGALRRAVEMQQDHPRVWDQIVATGMREDWSWARSARHYELLYRHILTHVAT
jgi:starch synthase